MTEPVQISVAGLLDTPQFTLQLHKRGLGKEKCVKYLCAWLNRFNKIKIHRGLVYMDCIN